jgi:hypothetical protein
MVQDPIDIFLCHNSADKDWVRDLGRRIEQVEWNGRRLRVFFDEWDIEPGENILLRIEEGLKRSRFIGVVLSPEMTKADWPTMEWTTQVYQDPAGKRGRIIPILVRDTDRKTGERIEIPLPLTILNRLDFREKSNYTRELNKFIRRLRNEPPIRGRLSPGQSVNNVHPATAVQVVAGLPVGQERPDPIEEILLSNLLPVLKYPTTIWSAPTDARKPSDIWENIEDTPPFKLAEKRLYTFTDLQREDNPFKQVIKNEDLKAEPVGPWIYDSDKWNWFLHLMRQALKNWCYKHAMLEDKRRYFFRPQLEGGQDTNRLFYGFTKGKPRTVTKKCIRPNGSIFWVHQAVRLQYETLATRLYLKVDPCWVFTKDGKNVLTGKTVGPLSTKWGGKEQNGPILRHVIFWGHVLAKGLVQIRFPAGDSEVVIGRVPVLTNINVGIESDHLSIKALEEQMENEIDLATEMIDLEETTPEEDDDRSEEFGADEDENHG